MSTSGGPANEFLSDSGHSDLSPAQDPSSSEGLEGLLRTFMKNQDARFESLSRRVEQVYQQRQSIMDRLDEVSARRAPLTNQFQEESLGGDSAQRTHYRPEAGGHDHSKAEQTPAKASARNRESFGGFASDTPRTLSSASDRDSGHREPTLRLKVPELKVQKTYSYEDVLGFLDLCHGHMTAWEALPVNKEHNRRFPDANSFPISLIPMPAAEYICSLIGYIYSVSHCRLKTEAEVAQGKFWSQIDGDTLRSLLVKARIENHCLTENLARLTRIRFASTQPYDLHAWVEFNHDLNKEVRYSSEGNFEYSDVDLKDHIIKSFPDATYQKELYLMYGNRGILKGRFQVGELLSRIDSRIRRFIKDNIANEQNRSAQHQHLKAHNLTIELSTPNSDERPEAPPNPSQSAKDAQQSETPPTYSQSAKTAQTHVRFSGSHEQWANERDDQDIQDMVNAALIGDKSCSRTGTGLDGLLNCRFLGKNGTCTFKHPEADMRLKGKGVTEKPSVTMPQGVVMSSRPSKVYHAVDDTFEA
jgi:hypothetical protein